MRLITLSVLLILALCPMQGRISRAYAASQQLTLADTVRTVAERGLAMWKEYASRNPVMWKLKGREEEIDKAQLTLSYQRYLLWAGATKRYLTSDVTDPTGFCSVLYHVFIIQSGGDYLGAVYVRRIEPSEKNWKPTKASEGDYDVVSFDSRIHRFNPLILNVSKRTARDSLKVVGLVEFSGAAPRIPLYVILARDGKKYMVSVDEARSEALHLIPMSEAGTVKTELRHKLELEPNKRNGK